MAEQSPPDYSLPCDVRHPGQLRVRLRAHPHPLGHAGFPAPFHRLRAADDLHGRVTDSSAEGFALAMDVSCHSFIRMARLAEPLMTEGGCLLAVTFYGSDRVVEHYNLMGPVKAALESSVRYLAAELGSKGIRVHAVSPGPIATRAASGIERFDELMDDAPARAPEHNLADSPIWQPRHLPGQRRRAPHHRHGHPGRRRRASDGLGLAERQAGAPPLDPAGCGASTPPLVGWSFKEGAARTVGKGSCGPLLKRPPN